MLIDLQKHSKNTVESSMELERVLQVPSFVATYAVLVLCASERVVFEGSAAALVQTYTAIWPGSKLSVVLLRLVMQDAMRKVFDTYPEVRIKCFCG